MTARPNILIFDSGGGGLSVAKEILLKTPHCQLHYFADNSLFPYGLRNDEVLGDHIVLEAGKLIKLIHPDYLVLACNTASTLALDKLRDKFGHILPSKHFIGVVPAIKPAAQITKSGAIGVLATPATVKRGYTKQLIEDFANEKHVFSYGSEVLAEQAEQFLTKREVSQSIVQQELINLLTQSSENAIDTIVLACTHFPILKPLLNELALAQGVKINWVDSGEAIARRVAQLESQRVPESNDIIRHTTHPSITFHFSKHLESNATTEKYYREYLLS